MSHLDDSGQQMDVWPKQSPLTRFARLCIGATWWIVASLATRAHDNVHSSGCSFGELLAASRLPRLQGQRGG